MPKRIIVLQDNQAYHVYNRSIGDYVIFKNQHDYARMILTIAYYQQEKSRVSFSHFFQRNLIAERFSKNHSNVLVDIIAYCLMPNHFHLVLRQRASGGISDYMMRVLNSYSRYFNLKYNRKGPLWESRFEAITAKSEEHLMYLTRYVHLNPTTANMVKNPLYWPYSSFGEYVKEQNPELPWRDICCLESLPKFKPEEYYWYAVNYIDEQREMVRARKKYRRDRKLSTSTPGVDF